MKMLFKKIETYRKRGYAQFGERSRCETGEWVATLRKLRPSPEEMLRKWRFVFLGIEDPAPN